MHKMTPHLFVVILEYIVPIEEVESHIIPHREYLDQYYQSGHFLASGPQVPRNGGIILAQAKNKEELEQILQQDPFSLKKIATYRIIEFNAIKSAKILDEFWI